MEASPTLSSAGKQDRAAQRVLDTLDRWDERLNSAYAAKRQYARNSYRTRVTVIIPAGKLAESAQPERIQAWARNISQGGLSLVHNQQITARRLIVSLNPAVESPTWFYAEIVRAREVQDGFWEHGIKFLERAAV